jgi:hypothetical protein
LGYGTRSAGHPPAFRGMRLIREDGTRLRRTLYRAAASHRCECRFGP